MPDTKITLRSIVLDCPDPWALAGFYSALLGWDRHCEDPEWVSVGRMGTLPFLLFQEVEDYRPPVWPEKPGAAEERPPGLRGRGPGRRRGPGRGPGRAEGPGSVRPRVDGDV